MIQVTLYLVFVCYAMGSMPPADGMGAGSGGNNYGTEEPPLLPPTRKPNNSQSCDDLHPTKSSVSSLYERLLTDYDKRLRPLENQSKQIVIETTFILDSITNLDVANQVLTVQGLFVFKWLDGFLNWDPCKYGGTKVVKLDSDTIWTPGVSIINSVVSSDKVFSVKDRIMVTPRGSAIWVPVGTYSFFCDVNIKFFPFDKQSCTLILYVPDEIANELSFKPIDGGAQKSVNQFSENSEWELMKIEAISQVVDDLSTLQVKFQLKRRPDFMIYTMILPLILLTIMNTCTFLVPITSGEKCSLTVTIFMTYGVILTFTSDSLPNNSLQVSIFIVYKIWLLMFSLFTVIYSFLQSRICAYHGNIVVKCFGFLGTNKISMHSTERMDTQSVLEDKNVCETVAPVLTWQHLMRKLDIVLFVICLVLHVVSSITIFIYLDISEQFD